MLSKRLNQYGLFSEKLLQLQEQHKEKKSLVRSKYIEKVAQVLNGYSKNALELVYKKNCDEAQQRYSKLIQDVQAEYSQKTDGYPADDPTDTVYFSSYTNTAKALGLDLGVTPDIKKYVSDNHDYNRVTPLLHPFDLRYAMYKEAALNEADRHLTRRFYDFSYCDEDTSLLEQAVYSIDLTTNGRLFKHACVFNSHEKIRNENTLYIDCSEHRVVCHLLSPDKKVVLTHHYPMYTVISDTTLSAEMLAGSLQSFIQANYAWFVDDMRRLARINIIDAFDRLLETMPSFKAHVVHTIAESNRELARTNGFESGLGLTKAHMCRSAGQNIYGIEQSPLFVLRAECAEKTATLNAECMTIYDNSKKEMLQTIEDKENACNAEKRAYHAALDHIEDEMEWPYLEAIVPTDMASFDEYMNAQIGLKANAALCDDSPNSSEELNFTPQKRICYSKPPNEVSSTKSTQLNPLASAFTPHK